jgi:DNA-directed RNA polymerase I subunit RPA1
MDSSTAQKTADKEQNGLRQLLERKEGMFRMKMMGKRVNFGARSVISPDPYITTDQIGVPIFMAKKLTFPESVSEVNVERLRKAVINGPKVHPGANIVEDQETGTKQHLETLSVD